MSTIPEKFEGKIYFYWWVKYSGSILMLDHCVEMKDYIYLGCSDEITVELGDPRAAIVESLESKIVTERAESQRRIAIMQGRIQELLALEVHPK